MDVLSAVALRDDAAGARVKDEGGSDGVKGNFHRRPFLFRGDWLMRVE